MNVLCRRARDVWTARLCVTPTRRSRGTGKHRIYLFSLPRTMIPAWKAGDQVARNTSKRSGNAYVDFVTTSWQAGSYGACSSRCGGGTETRSVACVDSKGVTRADSWCTGAKPDASQACGASACEGIGANMAEIGGVETYALTPQSTVANGLMYLGQQCFGGLPPFMPPTCMPNFIPFDYWDAKGAWQSAETTDNLTVKVSFASKPIAEGDFAAGGAMTIGAPHAYVEVRRTVTGVGLQTYASTSASAGVKVRWGHDNKLHALVDDPALPGAPLQPSLAIKADVQIDAP